MGKTGSESVYNNSPLQKRESTGKEDWCCPKRYSNERSTKFQSLYQDYKYLEEEIGKMKVLQISPKIGSCMDWADRSQNYKDLYEILQLLQDSI